MKYIDNTPSAAPLLASLRDIGYSMDTAMEDILDNCITAKSTSINIDFSWNEGDPWVCFVDDGVGMNTEELIIAMRPGSKNPIDERSSDDLGRFGLGLKTASFSQCKELTVITSKNNNVAAARIDLDDIIYHPENGFRLALLSHNDINDISEIKHYVDKLSGGTIVLWRKMDRVDEFDTKKNREMSFEDMMLQSREHIETTFHRYLSPLRGDSIKKIKIFLNNDILKGFDPFNSDQNATRELPEKKLYINRESLVVQPYILPHDSKLNKEDYIRYAGKGGYVNNQGFYIYRNKRLIKKSTWFGLIVKHELTKLVRVRIDIPNSLDKELKVNIMKSSISLPKTLKDQLKTVISQIESEGQKVYRQRGAKITNKNKKPLWLRNAASGKISYLVDKTHPILLNISKKMSNDNFQLVMNLISSIETSLPTQSIYVDSAKNPNDLSVPIMDKKKLKDYLEVFLSEMIVKYKDKDEVARKILSIDPFLSNIEDTKQILNEMGFDI